ncbi:MAG TPA: CHAD domain-containing protein [Stellaceae bacterium]|nr:CHAD domain-containing protein [Stellaceae bacterium]
MQAATRVEAAALAADLTVGDGLQEMLAGALSALRSRSAATSRPSAETVHRFRVGVRRLRSILSAFTEALPPTGRRALDERLGAVAQRYGRVREWDVFLAQCLAPLRAALPDEPALRQIAQRAQAARRQAMPLGHTLLSQFGAIEEALADAPWLRRPEPEQAECWDMALGAFAAGVVAKRHRQLRKRIKAAELADQAACHQLRIRVKKLRYPAELVKSLFDEDRAKSYLRRLTDLQDLLGRMNDAHVGGELMQLIDLPAPAHALVAGWLARDVDLCRAEFPACARALLRAEPFWET